MQFNVFVLAKIAWQREMLFKTFRNEIKSRTYNYFRICTDLSSWVFYNFSYFTSYVRIALSSLSAVSWLHYEYYHALYINTGLFMKISKTRFCTESIWVWRCQKSLYIHLMCASLSLKFSGSVALVSVHIPIKHVRTLIFRF